MEISLIIRIHNFILAENTGAPNDFAYKLNISVRSLYNYISFMKSDMNASIEFDRKKNSYIYIKDSNLCFVS